MDSAKTNSPKLANFLMKFFLSNADYDQLTGDFEEYYNYILKKEGKGKADRWFWIQLIKCVPNFIIFSFYWSGAMFKNYFKIAYRNIIRHKGYAFINITGLAIGLASFMLITLFVIQELSYDNFHEKGDRLYRLERKGEWKGRHFHVPVTGHGYGKSISYSIPEIESFVRIDKSEITFQDENNNSYEETAYFTDHNIFNDFSYNLIEGDPDEVLVKPNSIVITPEMAKKYFSTENAIGKRIRMEWGSRFVSLDVTGIMERLPDNTHLNSQFFISYKTLVPLYGEEELNELGNNSIYTYVVLKEGIDEKEIRGAVSDWFSDKVGGRLQEAMGNNFDISKIMELKLHSVKDIHLYGGLSWEIEPQSDMKIVTIFLGVSILILLIACINFMNLSTARSAGRAKEVGLRKVVGATKKYLMNQFLAESVFLSILAVLIGIVIVQILLPWFNNFTMKNLELNLIDNPFLLIVLIAVTLITGIGSGLYPAIFLSSFQPAKVLQGTGKSGTGGKSSKLRNLLVISQFAITIALMAGTIILIQQMDYVKNRDLGFEKERKLVVNVDDNELMQRLDVLLPELNKHSNILLSSVSYRVPGDKNWSDTAFKLLEASRDDFELSIYSSIDEHYINTMGIKLLAGRVFSREHPAELEEGLIVNELFTKKMGYKTPQEAVDKHIEILHNSSSRKIIGVVKDFNFKPLQQKLEPIAFRYNRSGRYVTIRIKNASIPETINYVKGTVEKFSAKTDFSYFFLDEQFDAQYKKEERIQKLFGYFSLFAIFIACLGLFGLAAYITERRTKEIGIRKVMGAGVNQIITMLSREFLKWVVIANIIAWPVAYYFMDDWLNNFAYRIDLGVLPFILSGIMAVLIALVTVTYQTYKAAVANPIESITCE
ncbi:MAG: FtsX-like permease family protein [Rhodothermaceae bacterium]